MKKIFSKGIIIFSLLVIFVVIVVTGTILNKSESAEIKAEKVILSNFRKVNSNSLSDESLSNNEESNITLGKNDDGVFESQKVYKSEIIPSKFSFSAIGSQWQEVLPEGTNLILEVRSYDGIAWSPWYEVERLEDYPDDRGVQHQGQVPGNLVFVENGQAVQYQITLSSEDGKNAPCLNQIDLTYIDSDSGFELDKITSVQEAQAVSQPSIISRSQWGCDESLRNWGPEYRQTEKIIIHHTAGQNNPSNPAATVRAIYYYHAVSLDWGDIGYNYLIDQHGNIYEGRYGGNNVVAGHAYHYNYGTCGISILGNYTSASSSAASIDSLVNLAAFKCSENFLDPLGSNNYQRSDGPIHYGLPNIIGHRDVGATACPGGILYSRLGEIRHRTKEKVKDLEWVSQSNFPSLYPGEETTLEVRVRNTSSETWYSDGSNPVRLGTSHPQDRESLFYASDWTYESRPTNMSQAQVESGEIATFNFKIKAPLTSGTYREYFQVVSEWNRWFSDIGLYWDIEVKPGLQWVKQSNYIKVDPGEERTLWVEFKNTGTTPWYSSGSNPVRLGTSHPQDRESVFYDESWIYENRACTFTNISNSSNLNSILPGEVARFTFKVSAPFAPGAYREYFQVVSEWEAWFPDLGIFWDITVEQPKLDLQWISQSSFLSLKPGQSSDCWVEFKNTGNITWKNYGEHSVNLGTSNPQDRNSIFYKEGDWINPQRPCKLSQSEVKPGEVGRFNFKINVPFTYGTYKEYFNPVCEGIGWFDNSHGFYTQYTVSPDFSCEWVAQSNYPNLTPGQKADLWVNFRNTGSQSWSLNSNINLATTKPINRQSVFYDSASWLNQDKNRPCHLNSNITSSGKQTVDSGEVGRFSFTVLAPSTPGYYREHFVPVVEGIGDMNDIGLYWDILAGDAQPNIRVGLYDTYGAITVTGNGSYQLCDSNNNPLTTLGPGQTTTLHASGGQYTASCSNGYSSSNLSQFRVKPLGSTIIEVSSYYNPGWGGRNDNRFRGLVEYRWSAATGSFWVINELTLEDYLYGLAEEPNWWPKEALKAHMVAARGYAFYNIYHPKTTCSQSNFHVFPDWRSQTYKGYAFEQAVGSPNHLKEAAQETFGQVVYYGNDLALVPYHSDCGGYTSDYSNIPYLKSVYCPYSQGHSRNGHGWGLCMVGVQGFANNGYGYADIIKHYLTGVDVRRGY